jgi:hypothetical protein
VSTPAFEVIICGLDELALHRRAGVIHVLSILDPDRQSLTPRMSAFRPEANVRSRPEADVRKVCFWAKKLSGVGTGQPSSLGPEVVG